MRRDQIVVLSLIFSGGMINYMDRAVFGILAPLVQKDLRLTPAELGYVFSIFPLGYLAFAYLSGTAAERYGPRIVLLVSMSVWSLFCALTGAAAGFVSLLLVRLGFGAWESPWVPGSNLVLAQHFTQKNYAVAYGISSAGQPLGGAIAGPLIGFAAVLVGWRGAFLAVGLLGCLWVIAWTRLAPRVPGVQSLPVEGTAISAQPLPPSGSIASLAHPSILAAAFGFGTANYALSFFLTWFPSYLAGQRGVQQVTMSVMTAVPWLLGAVGLAAGGVIADMARRRFAGLAGRKFVLVLGLGVSAFCMIMVPLVSSTHAALVLMAVALGLLYLGGGPNYFSILHEIAARRILGRATGLLVTSATLSAIISPIVTGWIVGATGSFTGAFATAAMVMLAGAVTFAVVVRETLHHDH